MELVINVEVKYITAVAQRMRWSERKYTRMVKKRGKLPMLGMTVDYHDRFPEHSEIPEQVGFFARKVRE